MGTIRDSEEGLEVPMYDRPRWPAKALLDDIDKVEIRGYCYFGDCHYPSSYSFNAYPESHYIDEKD